MEEVLEDGQEEVLEEDGQVEEDGQEVHPIEIRSIIL